MAPKRQSPGQLDIPNIIRVSACISLAAWIIPLLWGKYSPVFYPTISPEEIAGKLIEVNAAPRDGLPLCESNPPKLEGLKLDVEFPKINSAKQLREFAEKEGVQRGGVWQPTHCIPRYAATIIVGVRNRTHQLNKFLPFMHTFLSKQLLRYRLIVVEQDNSKPYNRGKIFNIGYLESQKISDRQGEEKCLVFHDVDLIPLNDHNIYGCTEMPRHMSVAVDTFRFQLPYTKLCGGAIAIQASQFDAVGGFSNRFDGWGGEDDEFCERLLQNDLRVDRFSPSIAMYHMLHHVPAPPNTERHTVYSVATDYRHTVYSVANEKEKHQSLMYHIKVDW